jgi:hypothetical protein
VPSCRRGEQRDDRGGLGCLPAVQARGPHGSYSGAPCLRGCEGVGYPDGQASGSGERLAARAVWHAPALTLPSVGRPMLPGGLRRADWLGDADGASLGGRDRGSSQESGGHGCPDDPGDLRGRQG